MVVGGKEEAALSERDELWLGSERVPCRSIYGRAHSQTLPFQVESSAASSATYPPPTAFAFVNLSELDGTCNLKLAMHQRDWFFILKYLCS